MSRINKKGRIILDKHEENRLFLECGGKCALCDRPLIAQKGNGVSVRVYEAAHVYPHRPTAQQLINLADVPKASDVESIDNIILLCPQSHKIQDYQTTREEYLKLYQIKQNQRSRYDAQMEIAEIDIEPEIDEILTKLSTLDDKEMVSLRFKAVSIKGKIHEKLLQRKIYHNISLYFRYIKSRMQLFDAIQAQKSICIAKEMSLCYSKVKMAGGLFCSQEDIFETLVEWLASKTNRSHTACEIVVSYFVQECEVFDAPSK